MKEPWEYVAMGIAAVLEAQDRALEAVTMNGHGAWAKRILAALPAPPCPKCGGWGFEDSDETPPCPKCRGTGEETRPAPPEEPRPPMVGDEEPRE